MVLPVHVSKRKIKMEEIYDPLQIKNGYIGQRKYFKAP